MATNRPAGILHRYVPQHQRRVGTIAKGRMLDFDVAGQFAGIGHGAIGFRKSPEDRKRPLVERDDAEKRDESRAQSKGGKLKLHKRCEEGQKRSGRQRVPASLVQDPRRCPEDRGSTQHGNDRREDREADREGARLEGDLLLPAELFGPCGERPVLRSRHPEFRNAIHELQQHPGEPSGHRHRLALIAELHGAGQGRREHRHRGEAGGQQSQPPAVVEEQGEAEHRRGTRKERRRDRVGHKTAHRTDAQTSHREIARRVVSEERHGQAQETIPNRRLQSRVHL